MAYLFIGPLYKKEEESKCLSYSKVGLSSASNTYQLNLIEGLKECTDRLDILNVLPVGTCPNQYTKLFLQTKKWSNNTNGENIEIGSINLPFLKQIIRTIKVKKYINRWIKQMGNDKIIIYSTYQPFLSAIKSLPKNIHVSLIITDLPEFYDLNTKAGRMRDVLRKINTLFIYKSIKRVSSFVLLTKQMYNKLNINEKPYVIIEGISQDVFEINNEKNDIEHKVILYAGTLHYKFGIKNLLDAFKLIVGENYKLWICGSGEAEDEVVSLSKLDTRVKFFGHVTKSEVMSLQNRATILINPRQNDDEYTKYSFPSKTIEYMVSGKPVLMYKLDGIPEEYDRYLYYVNGKTINDLKVAIEEVCNKTSEELKNFAMEAREFVLKRKNCYFQAKKITNMIINNFQFDDLTR